MSGQSANRTEKQDTKQDFSQCLFFSTSALNRKLTEYAEEEFGKIGMAPSHGFVLLVAWVNYINLSTAKSLERAKEVGVRKVLGTSRASLISITFPLTGPNKSATVLTASIVPKGSSFEII